MTRRALIILVWAFVITVEGFSLWTLLHDYTVWAEIQKPTPPVVVQAIPDPGCFLIPDRYRAWVMESCAEFGVPLDVGIRLIYEESAWNEKMMHRNRNGSYDHGLTSLNSRYFRIMLTRANIRAGISHWADLWHRLGTIRAATIAYQTGVNAMYRATKRTLYEADAVATGRL